MTIDRSALTELFRTTLSTHRSEAATRSGLLSDGLRVGRWRSWRPDGTLLVEADYHRGHRHGVWTKWHPNGALAVRLPYRAGALAGSLEAWYADGGRALSASTAAGAFDGPFRVWRPSGGLWALGRFDQGLLGQIRLAPDHRRVAPLRAYPSPWRPSELTLSP